MLIFTHLMAISEFLQQGCFMALKIKDFFKVKPVSTIETSIGTLCLFPINVGEQKRLLKDLGMPIDVVTPKEYLKKLLVYVCYPQKVLKDEKYKPDNPVLTLDEINQFSDQELEYISEDYLKNNEYLFKCRVQKQKKDDNGNVVTYSELGDIEHPKSSDESQINYLHRLSCIEQDNQNRTMQSFLDSAPKNSIFSESLSSDIKDGFRLGDALINNFNQDIARHRIELNSAPYALDNIDFQEIETIKEKNRREPFDDLAKRLDKLINSSNQASEFMVLANKLQTEIAAEIKSGGDATDQHARRNLKLSYVVIFLTVLGLLFTAWSSFSGVSLSDEQQSDVKQYTSDISESLARSAYLLDRNEKTSSVMLSNVVSELKGVKEAIKERNSDLEKALNDIDLLKSENAEYKTEIYNLKKELEKIKLQRSY